MPRPLDDAAAGPLGAEERLRIARELAEAVVRLHAAGRVHGALAPGRVLVSEGGAVIVLPPPPAPEPPLARAGFDAPEVARGARPTPRSDAFSAAALAWLVLAGRPPFDGAHPADRVQRALFGDPGAIRLAAPGVTREVEEAVLAALEKRPRRRASADALARALGARAAAPASPGPRAPWLVSLPRLWLPGLPSFPRVRLPRLPRLPPLRLPRLPLAPLAIGPVRAGLAALALLVATAPFVRADAALAREVGSLLARGDVASARRRVDAAARARPDDPVVEKLRGDVACARGAADECLRRYRIALASRPALREDRALRQNARRLVQPDEACGTRRAAAHLLGELRDPDSLPALERARRASGLLAWLCTGDALDRALAATRDAAR